MLPSRSIEINETKIRKRKTHLLNRFAIENREKDFTFRFDQLHVLPITLDDYIIFLVKKKINFRKFYYKA